MPRLISVNDISASNLTDYVVLFASMTNPVSGQADDPADGFIPGAIKFDLDGEGSDHTSSLPHTLPEQAALSALFGKLGITTDKPVRRIGVHAVVHTISVVIEIAAVTQTISIAVYSIVRWIIYTR